MFKSASYYGRRFGKFIDVRGIIIEGMIYNADKGRGISYPNWRMTPIQSVKYLVSRVVEDHTVDENAHGFCIDFLSL